MPCRAIDTGLAQAVKKCLSSTPAIYPLQVPATLKVSLILEDDRCNRPECRSDCLALKYPDCIVAAGRSASACKKNGAEVE